MAVVNLRLLVLAIVATSLLMGSPVLARKKSPPKTAPSSASNIIARLDCGKRYSEATVHNKIAYCSGQVPENTNGQDIKAQTQDTLDIIDKLLARAGTDKSRILTATIYLVNMDADYAGMNEVWDAWVAPEATPARATVQVSKLADPGWKIEIVVTAAMP